MAPADLSSLTRQADEAVVMASARPATALELARQVREHTRDKAVASVAERALGLAIKELGDVTAAARHLRNAVVLGERAGDPVRAAQARMSLSVVLANRGQLVKALAETDRAAAVLAGADAARLLAQRGQVLTRMGRYSEAMACYDRALPTLRRYGDARFEAGTLLNRGALHAYDGSLRAAQADLSRCVEIATAAGLDLLAALGQKNLAFVAMRRGDIPAALQALDRAETAYDGQSLRLPEVWLDRAYTLLAARLAEDARHELARAITRFDEIGDLSNAAEARLLWAEAALLGGDMDQARQAAERSAATLRRQRRHGWADLADQLALRARWESGERSVALLRAARRSAARLEASGWPEASLRSRILAARVLIARGSLRAAADELSGLAAARQSGTAELRTAAWHAHALLRLSQDDRRGALAGLRAGLRLVNDYAASLGATDLRAHAAGYGQELARLGLRIAVDGGRARNVLQWSERFRAGAMRRRPVRPPDDRQLAADLAELRRVTSQIAEALAARQDTGPLRAAQVRLERAIRDRSRHAPDRHAPAGVPGPDLGRLQEQLGDRALVEYVRLDGELYAVTLVGGRARLHTLGSYDDVLRHLESLRFLVHRLARQHGSVASLEAARLGLKHSAAVLDDALVRPFAREIAERALVLVPTMALHALPWTILPSVSDRPVSVTPSAAIWLKAVDQARRRRSRTVLVAGPGLQHAGPEVAALAGLHAQARVLTGDAATADAVRTLMAGADLVHIAAHGRFRGDNPQFSCLELADGPLTVYDLERLRAAPRRLVLSACDSALSAVRPGDELMGLASAMFALGTATLIASVAPVPDEATSALMVQLHGRLAAGMTPAQALAEAQQTTDVYGFVCFGAG